MEHPNHYVVKNFLTIKGGGDLRCRCGCETPTKGKSLETEEGGIVQRGRGLGEGGRGREESPVSSPSSGYNSSGTGGNGGGSADLEDLPSDERRKGARDDVKQLPGDLDQERAGLEEQLLIDLSSPGEEGRLVTWEGVKMVNMPDGSQNSDDRQHATRGKMEDGRTQGIELKGGSSEVDQPSHCCHHISCHSHKCHLSQWCQHGHKVKGQHVQDPGIETSRNRQFEKSGGLFAVQKGIQEKDGGPTGRSTTSSTASRSSSSTPSSSTAGARQSSHQSPTTRSSPSPSRRPGWTEFSDDEDVNFTRWKPFILHEKFCFISGTWCFLFCKEVSTCCIVFLKRGALLFVSFKTN